jgi:uncharacterized protein (DUF433 family)
MNSSRPFPRITYEADKMGGQPCIRGLRIPVATVLRCLSSKMSREEILSDYPRLEDADIDAALEYATALAEDRVVPLRPTGS